METYLVSIEKKTVFVFETLCEAADAVRRAKSLGKSAELIVRLGSFENKSGSKP